MALKTAITSPPCTPGTWSPAALSSYFAPPTWIRPPTTLGGRAAASSHACGLHNINQPFAQARLPHVRPERVSSFSLQCGSGTQRARRDSAARRCRAAVARACRSCRRSARARRSSTLVHHVGRSPGDTQCTPSDPCAHATADDVPRPMTRPTTRAPGPRPSRASTTWTQASCLQACRRPPPPSPSPPEMISSQQLLHTLEGAQLLHTLEGASSSARV